MGASAPEAPPPPTPVSAPDEGSMIVEDQLTHNFMPKPDHTTKDRVYAAEQNVSRSWKWFCSKLPMTLTSRFMET